MNIIAVDDEQFALKGLINAISATRPNAEIHGFHSPLEALQHAADAEVDVAFLDIEMVGMNGLELAKQLKELHGKTNIVFVTAFSEFAVNAFQLHASDFLLKPVTREKVIDSLDHLRFPVLSSSRIRVQTFGNFELFVNDLPVHFSRLKSKEILAYLIDKNGTSVNKSELAAVLWEDAEYTRSRQQLLQELITWLMKDLQAVGAEKIITRKYNSLFVNKETFQCDVYAFMCWDTAAINSYNGEYMSNYSWAEFRLAYMERRLHNLGTE